MGTRVYVGRLNYDIRERDIEKFFKGYGRIREILIKNGFGFVEFDDYRDADDAVYELNGKDLLGERVTVEHARGPPRGNDLWASRNRGGGGGGGRGGGGGGGGGGNRQGGGPMRRRTGRDSRYGPPTRTDYRLVVENLSSRVSWQDLKDFMRQAGEVTYADAHKEYRNKGVVEFASLSDLKTALDKLDNAELSGRRIKLREDKSHRRRSRSRSASQSRSRSKSTSRSRSRSKSRSRSASRSQSQSRSHSKSKSPSRSRSRSRSKSQSKSPRRSRSKSASPEHEGSKSPEEQPAESPERD